MEPITSRCAVISPDPGSPVTIRNFQIDSPPVDSIHVKVLLAGICGTDPHLWKGDLPLSTSIVLGHEGVGEVVALHSSVTTDHANQPLRKGDLVYWTAIRPCGRCYRCTVADDQCGCSSNGFMHAYDELASSKDGTWATYTEYATLGPRNSFYRASSHVPPEAYIALGCALPTVIQATSRLRHSSIESFENVVVQGCGAVGLAAIMMAKISGAQTIVAIDGNPLRLAKAKEFGADECINLKLVTDADDRAQRTFEAVGSRGVGLVIECSGHASAVTEGFNLLSRNGTYLLIGTWAGEGTVPFDPFAAVNKAISVHGSTYCAPRDYYRAMKVVEQNWQRFPLISCVTHRFSLNDTQKGLEAVVSGAVVKGVIEPHR